MFTVSGKILLSVWRVFCEKHIVFKHCKFLFLICSLKICNKITHEHWACAQRGRSLFHFVFFQTHAQQNSGKTGEYGWSISYQEPAILWSASRAKSNIMAASRGSPSSAFLETHGEVSGCEGNAKLQEKKFGIESLEQTKGAPGERVLPGKFQTAFFLESWIIWVFFDALNHQKSFTFFIS